MVNFYVNFCAWTQDCDGPAPLDGPCACPCKRDTNVEARSELLYWFAGLW